MDSALRILFVIFAIFVFILFCKFLAVIIRVFYGVYLQITPPLKKFILWEIKHLRVIAKNLFYAKEDIYNTLAVRQITGSRYQVNLPLIKRNHLLRSLWVIVSQLLITGFFLKKDLPVYDVSNLETAAYALIGGLILGYLYFEWQKPVLSSHEGVFIYSSVNELMKHLNIKRLTHSHILVILNHLKDKSTLPSEHKTSYPNLARYFLKLHYYPDKKYGKGEYFKLKVRYFFTGGLPVDIEKKRRVYNIFIDLVSFLN